MTDRAYMMLPLPVTIVDADWQDANPPANMLNDEMARVWRSQGNYAVFTFTTSGAPVDVIAFIGTNLLATDTVQIVAGNDTNYSSYDSGVLNAWSGTKADDISAKSIVRISSPVTYTHWSVTLYSATNSYVEVARLAVGQALTHPGVGFDAQVSFYDPSDVTIGPNYQSTFEYPVVPIWKISFDMIEADAFYTQWVNFWMKVGNKQCILFVPDDGSAAYRQNMAVYGTPTGEYPFQAAIGNFYSTEITIRARKA